MAGLLGLFAAPSDATASFGNGSEGSDEMPKPTGGSGPTPAPPAGIGGSGPAPAPPKGNQQKIIAVPSVPRQSSPTGARSSMADLIGISPAPHTPQTASTSDFELCLLVIKLKKIE